MTTLQITGVRKTYGATRAVDDVSMCLEPGQVHTVLGENGSGKSTLVKILSGVTRPEVGTLTIGDETITRFSPRLVQSRGVQTVFQEVLTAPNRSLLDNVFVGFHPLLRRRISRAAEQARAFAMFERFGRGNVDLRALAGGSPLAIQQLTVIARALVRDPQVLILDEATAALGLVERDAVLEQVKRLRDEGVAVLFVSHRMDEIVDISDVVTVLRSGRVVGELEGDAITAERLLDLVTPTHEPV